MKTHSYHAILSLFPLLRTPDSQNVRFCFPQQQEQCSAQNIWKRKRDDGSSRILFCLPETVFSEKIALISIIEESKRRVEV